MENTIIRITDMSESEAIKRAEELAKILEEQRKVIMANRNAEGHYDYRRKEWVSGY